MTKVKFLEMTPEHRLGWLSKVLTNEYNMGVIISDSPVVNIFTGEALPDNLKSECKMNVVEMDAPEDRTPYNSKDFPSSEAFHEHMDKVDHSGKFEIEQIYPEGYGSIKPYKFTDIGEFDSYFKEQPQSTVVLYKRMFDAHDVVGLSESNHMIIRFLQLKEK